jgi:putative alpha-1,2-mannosidase
LFSKITINLENGKKFIIKAENLNEENIYIQSAKLNNKPLNKSWFCHTDIINGGSLYLLMGDKPSEWGKNNPPPSISD